MANSNYRLRSLIAIFLAVNSIANSQKPSDSFRESLTIRPLQDGKLHTLFKFELSTQLPTRPLESPTSSNIKLLQSDLLPLSILELTDRFGINQLSLSLSRGRWEFDRWSAPILEQWQGYPRGSELAVWLEPHANATELINTLAGMFCGSLNRLNLIKDAPLELFNPTFSDQHGHRSFYHGLLPIEQPCTENLSPLFKLLPCGPHAGLSSLIDGHQLFDGNWQSIRFKSFNYQSALELSPATRPSNSNSKLEIQIEIETVLDPVRKTTKRDWNLKSIFGKSVEKKCPLSSSSVIEIIEPTGPTETESLQRPTIHPRAHADGLPVEGRHKYDILEAVLPLDIEMKWPSEEKFEYSERYAPPPVTIKRLLLGHGQTRGLMGVEIEMSQSEINKEQEIVYLEELPWWLTIYLHTLSVEVDDVPINDHNEVITNKKIKPSLQRERPYSFALTLKFPQQKSGSFKEGSRKMKIWFEYEKDLLLYTEYASDANRGFDLNPAGLILTDSILQATDSVQRAGHRFGNASRTRPDGSRRYWTTCALIDLATPDFSMPYNVIIVTSTAMALFFGSVFNLLVRDFQLIKINQ
ncbi:hypothetical protein PCANC_05713 [Puccinia coronata f. sp. avenae]|uniref:Gpi16 subunit, GPI transamidase component n=1 Tax=Puccinia coronata f. sp. avenae TaxID=200324 RepID=A0A2N5VY05_9BASI|nr:hypothetical protein PCANC_05713 [Puccinia coronata f. sp. avenae]